MTNKKWCDDDREDAGEGARATKAALLFGPKFRESLSIFVFG